MKRVTFLVATIAIAFLPTLLRADDKSEAAKKLTGTWLYTSVTKVVDGEERQTPMQNSKLSFTEDGEWSQYMLAKNKVQGRKGTIELNKAGSLILNYDSGKYGPYKFTVSDDGKQLTLVGLEETYKLKFKEE